MTAYQQALQLAAMHGRDFYVNSLAVDRDTEILVAEPHKTRLLAAVAHPDGTLEHVVQGFSLVACAQTDR